MPPGGPAPAGPADPDDFIDLIEVTDGPERAEHADHTDRAGLAGSPPWRPFSSLVRGMLRFLAVALAGVAAMLGGLVWDAVVHARDPEAAHAEGTVFSLSNPAHLLLLAGGALVIVGVTAATVRGLALSGSRRLSSPRAAATLVSVVLFATAATAGVAKWAAEPRPLPLATGPLAPSPGPDEHGIGIVNSHAPGECRPTAEQKRAAARLVADTEAATARYRNLAVAQAEGFLGPPVPAATEHYVNVLNAQDGQVLDPARPEALMYTPSPSGPVLVGAMFLMNVPGEFGPEPGGCLTRWHVHANICFSATTFAIASLMADDRTCPPGEFRYIPPPALHVWLVDVPGGRFAAEVDPEDVARAVAGR